MNTFELLSVVVFGLAAIAGVSAAIYVSLPPSLLNSATRHGRYVGLGASAPHGDTPRGLGMPSSRLRVIGSVN